MLGNQEKRIGTFPKKNTTYFDERDLHYRHAMENKPIHLQSTTIVTEETTEETVLTEIVSARDRDTFYVHSTTNTQRTTRDVLSPLVVTV